MRGKLLLFTLLLHVSVQSSDAAEALPATAACRSSVYPKLCRALLSPLRLPSSPYEFGRFSVRQALKQALRTSLMLDRYLARRGGGGALEDCHQLAETNAEYLSAVGAELGPGESVLNAVAADRVRALMSALLTNQQTCFDGLDAANTFPELSASLSTGSRMYGVSLELVSSALETTGGANGFEPRGVAVGRGLVEEYIDVASVNQSVRVAKDGTGDFTSVGDAVAFAPNGTSIDDDGYFVIFIDQGLYEENVLIPKNKKNLKLIGVGADRTVITGNRSFVDGWTTYNSATFAVHGERFIAIDITFENTAGPANHQAVAVRNSADLSSFYRCRFLGYQDTLYTHSLRQFYRDCDVYGTVDFIFGNAAVVFQGCNIYARRPLPNQFNAVTAQGRTHPNQTTGISIHNCTVRAAPELVVDQQLNSSAAAAKTFLGRPWKEYSRTVYMQSFIGAIVEPVGWIEWEGNFALSTLYYGEFQNYGPGANTSGRVHWPGYNGQMNATEAFNFTVYNFTTGGAWLPSTFIPHSAGLV